MMSGPFSRTPRRYLGPDREMRDEVAPQRVRLAAVSLSTVCR